MPTPKAAAVWIGTSELGAQAFFPFSCVNYKAQRYHVDLHIFASYQLEYLGRYVASCING